ncbi:ABC transporter substrate-binding protein [Zooshikella harenae]
MLVSSAYAKNKSVSIMLNEWSSQIIISNIYAKLLNKKSIPYTFSDVPSDTQWYHLARGNTQVQVEVWQGSMEHGFNKLLKQGKIIDAGNHDAITREGWWYPAYVKPLCPGLPDWKALKKCSTIFSFDSVSEKGTFIRGPWGDDASRIRALKLNFNLLKVYHSDELWRILERFYAQKRPVVIINWTPNWATKYYKGEFITFPKYAPDCITNPKWGINPYYSHDCDYPLQGWLKKAAWFGLPKISECAFKILQQLNFNNPMIEELTEWSDKDKLTYKQAAQRWIDQNKTIWQKWLSTACPRA